MKVRSILAGAAALALLALPAFATDYLGGAVKSTDIGGKMVLTGPWKGSGGPGKDRLTRMTFSSEAGGAVRQLGEVSSDGGKSWSESFDFTYKPRRKPAGEGQ